MRSTPLELAQQLIRLRSITPQDAGCQDLVAQRLDSIALLLALDTLKSIYLQVLERLLLPA